MKEEIAKILGDETITTNEEKVDAIAKGLATLVIPKDIYNDLSVKYKTVESNYSTLNNEFEDFKKSKMTDEEKVKAEREQFLKDKRANDVQTSKYAVMDLFREKGIEIETEKMDKILTDIVTDNKDQTLTVANTIASVLLETKEQTQKQTVTELLNNTPKPVVGNPNSNTTNNVDVYKSKLDEAVKSGNTVDQATYTRLIFEEEHKQTI